jgi:hypothetical protein
MPGAPWWDADHGSVFAIAVGKQVFGGLGNIHKSRSSGTSFFFWHPGRL